MGQSAVSQEILAEMVETTPPARQLCMNTFRRLGFIEYDPMTVKVNHALIGVVLAD